MDVSKATRAVSAVRARVIASILGLSLIVGACAEEPIEGGIPVNNGFERPAVEGFARPWGWRPVAVGGGAGFEVDSTVARSGRRSLMLYGPGSGEAPDPDSRAGAAAAGGPTPDPAITLQSWIEPRFAHGRAVRVGAWTRSTGLDGRARLVVQVWGAGVLAADTVQIDAIEVAAVGQAAGTEWRRVDLAVRVDSSAHSLVLQAELEGAGRVWFDDLSVATDGREWNEVPAAADPPGPATLDWLESRSTAVRSVDAAQPGEDDATDLAAFGAIVGDARLVALGEATHGTSEFFRAKHRLLAYLVEELGFRAFAIEANQLAVEPINEYVHGGPGEPRTLMRAMFRVWNTEEMRDLIEWMRAHNSTHSDRPVEFVGFDMQDPSLPIDSLSAWLGRVEPGLRDRVAKLYAPYREAWRAGPYPQASDSVRESWYEAASQAYDSLLERRSSWPAPTMKNDRSDALGAVERALQNANLVRQAALGALTGEFATRDSAMAENIRWILDRRPAGTRMVVWAHDGHISRAGHEYANYWGGGSMGGRLSELFGDEYRVFGLLTYDGSYSGALGNEIIDAPLLPAPPGTLEEALHRVSGRLGSARLVTDLRDPPDPARSWLLEPRAIRMLGYAAEDVGLATGISVGAQFDAVVFIDSTNPSRVFR